MSGQPETLTKLFVGGIQPTCRESEIRGALSDYCEYISKVDIKMKNAFLNRGYAFIFVSNPSIADKMTKMKFKLGDRILQVQNINKNTREKEEYKLKRLYLKNLPPHTTDRELYGFFEKFGEIRSSYIIKDRFGHYRDYGFIDFERVEDVDTCLDALKSQPFVLRGSKVKVRRFIKLDEKKDEEELEEEEEPETDCHPPGLLPPAEIQSAPQLPQFNYLLPLPQSEWPDYQVLPPYLPLLLHFPRANVHAPSEMPTSNAVSLEAEEPCGEEGVLATGSGSCYSSPQVFFGSRLLKNKDRHSAELSKFCQTQTLSKAQTHEPSKVCAPEYEIEEDFDYCAKRGPLSYYTSIIANHGLDNLRLNRGASRQCELMATSPGSNPQQSE